MNYKKQIAAPSAVYRTIALPVEKWRENRLTLNHMKYRDGALTTAEGYATRSSFAASYRFTELYHDGSDPIVYSRINYFWFVGRNVRMNLTGVRDVCPRTEFTGDDITFILTGKALNYEKGGSLFAFNALSNGTCVTTHKDRIFFAQNECVHWSYLCETTFRSTGTQEAGRVELPARELGNTVRMAPLGDYVYIFRQYGIMRLFVSADTLDFRLETFYKGYSSLQARSLAVCNDKIYFFADETLFCLTEGGVRAVERAATDDILFSQTVFGADWKGEYYASVMRKNGTRAVYSYDEM